MRTTRVLVLIPAFALALVACSDDGDTTATTAAPTTTVATPDTAAPDTSAPDATTAGTDATDDTVLSGPVQIDVLVGTDSGPDRVVKVTVGSEITLNITNPNAADSYHVHGVDLEQDVEKNVTATFNFTADTAGEIEVESHLTDDVLVVIEVV